MHATNCADCDKLRRELLNKLDKVAKLAAAQGEALRSGEDSMFYRLEEAVEIALSEKQRSSADFHKHRGAHGVVEIRGN